MNLQFRGARIRGVQLVLPTKEVAFDEEASDYNFTTQQSIKLKKLMGYDRRRVVSSGTTSSDLLVAGFQSLSAQGLLDLNTIDALIVVTQTPDYLIPGTSYVIHNRLCLRKDMMCLDINQGCAGFIVGLITAFSLLNQSGFKRVALANVDVLSQLVASGDRNSRPIIGDAAAITIIDSDTESERILGNLKVDGAGWDALMVPAGGIKMRSGPDTAVTKIDANGNYRALDNLVMKGDVVFNFVMQDVPKMIMALVNEAGIEVSQIDGFLFHQPNPFMLRKLAEKIGIPLEKLPMDLVPKYGNSSGVTIPAILCTHYNKEFFNRKRLMCMAGFGVGLTWGSLLMPMHNILFTNVLEV